MLHNIAACHLRNKRIKRQKKYAQNKDAAKCYMKEYREKKKDSIQLNKQEFSGSYFFSHRTCKLFFFAVVLIKK